MAAPQSSAVHRVRTIPAIKDGIDFSGCATVSLGLKKVCQKMGIHTATKFACEKNKAAINITKHVAKPEIFHDDVLSRDATSLPHVDVYSFSSPCTSFSPAGEGRGIESNDGQLVFRR